MIDIARISDLLQLAPRPPEDSLPDGCADDEIDAFMNRTGIEIPDDLRAWLITSNGPCVGPGGLFGINPSRESQDIESILNLYPAWREKEWIPIAGDGCGNYFVIATKQEFGTGYPVLFVDTHDTVDDPAHIVASNIGHFLIFLLEKEQGAIGWPFSENIVRESDPYIVNFHSVTFPWNSR